jgi:MerR family transcriptional regulator, copper efflux regulator
MPAPPKRYKVGEIMRHTGLSRQTIHNYTMLGLINPVERTDSGHRLYDESVFDRIRKIELLKIHRTLGEIREMLEKEDKPAA